MAAEKSSMELKELDADLMAVETSDATYPASKQDLIKYAKINNSPQMVIDVLNQYEDKQYNTPEDVKTEFNRLQKK